MVGTVAHSRHRGRPDGDLLCPAGDSAGRRARAHPGRDPVLRRVSDVAVCSRADRAARRRRPASSQLAARAVDPAVLVRGGDRVGPGALRSVPGAARGAADSARSAARAGLPGDGRGRADPVGGRRHQGVHRVGAHHRGHRPRAARDPGQHHGWARASARAGLRHRRLDQDRRQDHRAHPRGPLAGHGADDQERRSDHRAQRPGGARRAHQLQPTQHRPSTVGLHSRPLPSPAGAGARAGGRRHPFAAQHPHRPGARLPAVGVQGRRGRLRRPLLDRRLPARRPIRQRGAGASSGTRCIAPGWRSRSRR